MQEIPWARYDSHAMPTSLRSDELFSGSVWNEELNEKQKLEVADERGTWIEQREVEQTRDEQGDSNLIRLFFELEEDDFEFLLQVEELQDFCRTVDPDVLIRGGELPQIRCAWTQGRTYDGGNERVHPSRGFLTVHQFYLELLKLVR